MRLYSYLDIRGLSPVGYSIFAFSLGVFLGILFKKQLIAIVTTLFIFVILRMILVVFVLPNMVTPVTANFPITQNPYSRLERTYGSAFALSFDYF